MHRSTYSFQIAIYPRKGTETERRVIAYLRIILQFIPARGRKRIELSSAHGLNDCNLSPQGDGNSLPSTIVPSGIYCNLSPQGDGNQNCIQWQVSHANCNLSPQGDTKKHLCHWRLPAAEVLCFFLYSILQVGNCACRNRLCDRQRLDALRDVPLQGADLMQVDGDLLQGLFNVLCIQRQNTLAL